MLLHSSSQESGLKSTVELSVAAAYVLNMCKMATVQIFLEHSNRDVHVGIGFVRNRNMSAGPIKDQPYPLCWRHQAQWMLHVTSNSSFSLLHIQAPTTVSLSTTADVAVVSKGRYN